ncbi:MAG: Fe-S oxidoreductase, partial [Actinobacteria bacterium]|nr:Fe-S oxidoreductase [Actinomycetota bacterium]
MTQLSVNEIWVYPVKSMVGGTVESCLINELGIVGDRLWAVRDIDNGGIRGAKKLGGLMKLSAQFVNGSEVVEITLPDGSMVRSDDAQANDLVSRAIGANVQLEYLRPASDLDHYRRGAPSSDDMMEELR